MRTFLAVLLSLPACGGKDPVSATSINLEMQGGIEIQLVVEEGQPTFTSGKITSLG